VWSYPSNGFLMDDDGSVSDWGSSAGYEKGGFDAVEFGCFRLAILSDAAIDGSLGYDDHSYW